MKNSVQCPECNSTNMLRVKPKDFVAFSSDYKCRDCDLQFPAPVPIWGSVLFIVLGLPFACLGAFWVYANLRSDNPIALIIGGGILAMGGASFAKGIASLITK